MLEAPFLETLKARLYEALSTLILLWMFLFIAEELDYKTFRKIPSNSEDSKSLWFYIYTCRRLHTASFFPRHQTLFRLKLVFLWAKTSIRNIVRFGGVQYPRWTGSLVYLSCLLKKTGSSVLVAQGENNYLLNDKVNTLS